jgi:tetratricopeptide (TPR) repeat protein
MKTAIRNINTEILEYNLQESWQSLKKSNDACEIKCDLKVGTLLVICQHPANVAIDREKTITELKSIVQKQDLESIEKVGICLNIIGHIYPYAYHSFFTKIPSERSILTFMPKWVDKDIDSEIKVTPELLDSLDNPFSLKDLEAISIRLKSEEKIEANTYVKNPNILGNKIQNSEIKITPKLLDDLDNPFDVEGLNLSPKKNNRKPRNHVEQKLPLIKESTVNMATFSQVEFISASLSLAILIGCFYAVTQPCVIGKCVIKSTAEELNQQSLEIIKNIENSLGPKSAQEKLETAIQNLKKIPFWSIHYLKSQHLKSTYQAEIEHLETIRKALGHGEQAAQNSKGLPLPVEDWVQIQSLWQEAISLLEKVPEESRAYPFAKNKLQQYRKYLVAIKGRLTIEEEANQKLIAAKKSAQLAETREIIAQFPESWKKVNSSWADALDKASTIPPQTTAYVEAKNLLPQYEQKLQKAEERRITEEIGQEAYNQTISYSKQAEVFETKDNWIKAKEYWQKALNSAEKIPTNSSYFISVKPLIKSYKTLLEVAQSNQKLLDTLAKVNQDLSKTCKGKTKICKYSVTKDLITVRFTSDYIDKIKKTTKAVENSKDKNSRTELEKHLKTLQTALKTISNNSNIPLEVYNPQGLKIAAHFPKS